MCDGVQTTDREKKRGKKVMEVRWGVEDHMLAQLQEPAYASRSANREEKRNWDERVRGANDAKE